MNKLIKDTIWYYNTYGFFKCLLNRMKLCLASFFNWYISMANEPEYAPKDTFL